MRFHAIQNVETALRFLRYKEIKLVNIRGEDIVDGNPKLTLGLIWTIILHFQVGATALSTFSHTLTKAGSESQAACRHLCPSVDRLYFGGLSRQFATFAHKSG